MSEETKDVSGEEEVTPTPEESKSVQDLIDEKGAETTEETEDQTETEGEEATPSPEEGEEVEEKPPVRQVPVSVVQKERQRRREAEAKAKAQEDRLAALEAQVKQPEPQQLVKPKLGDFETIEEYASALSDFADKNAKVAAKEVVAEELKSQAEAQKQQAAKQEAEKATVKFHKLMDNAHATDENFEESFQYVNGVSMQHAAYSNALVTSDVADKLIGHLAANPKEAERIATLSPVNQVKAIGAIEDKITAPPPKPKNITQAPKPVDAVSGNAKTGDIKWKAGMTKAERDTLIEQSKGVPISDLL